MKRERCRWCPEHIPEYVAYHDEEWGIPVHDDRHLFEMICLEGMQAGLTWLSILRRRQSYREAFDNFDASLIIGYDEEKIRVLLDNPGIIRNKRKVMAIIKNARVFLDIQREFGSFDSYLWGFSGGRPIINHFNTFGEIPAKTPLSEALSKDLKKRGMSFVGPVIIYAFMQAVGMVNDHETGCPYRRAE